MAMRYSYAIGAQMSWVGLWAVRTSAGCPGSGVVFMDTEGIGPGEQFSTELADALESAQIMLVIVGPSWAGELEERAQVGTNDWVVR